RPEPHATPRVGAGVVETVSGGLAGDVGELLEGLRLRGEGVETVLEAAQEEPSFGRQAPANLLGRLGPGVASGRGVEMPQAMALDVDEPHHAAIGVPQHAFAELALGAEDFPNVGGYLHPA